MDMMCQAYLYSITCPMAADVVLWYVICSIHRSVLRLHTMGTMSPTAETNVDDTEAGTEAQETEIRQALRQRLKGENKIGLKFCRRYCNGIFLNDNYIFITIPVNVVPKGPVYNGS